MSEAIANTPLPRGCVLHGHTILKKISAGGFSIVYLGIDEDGHPVAIKEYMPHSIPLRNGGTDVSAPSAEFRERYKQGLDSFFHESEALARIDSPHVVRVTDCFLANGTAYTVMSYEYGKTLQKIIQEKDGRLPEWLIRKSMLDLLDGLEMLHENGILHLDLKPSNLYVRADGSAVILDFGTSWTPGESSSGPPMHTPGFAAPEQHRKYFKPEHIGTWTDMYGVGTCALACMTGEPPAPAPDRFGNDEVPYIIESFRGMYSKWLLDTVHALLELEWRKRPPEAKSVSATFRRNVAVDRSLTRMFDGLVSSSVFQKTR